MRAFLLAVDQLFAFVNGKRKPIRLSNGMKILLIWAMVVSSFSAGVKKNVSVFRLYVEGAHDMDRDGQVDCVQLLVFVPAESGTYPTLLLASPYGMGTVNEVSLLSSQLFPKENDCVAKRKKSHAAIPENDHLAAGLWMNEGERILIDQFVSEGYAVVASAGPGTFGSDGWNTVLGKEERAVWHCIVSFLRGKQDAFLEPEGGRYIDAFWSDGTLMFLGHSYGGAIGLSLVQQDPDLFDAMILSAPVIDWKRWYENALNYSEHPMSDLASYCSSKVFEQQEWLNYQSYLSALENEAASGSAWRQRNYLNVSPHCPVLLLTSFRDEIIPSAFVYELFSLLEQSEVPVSLVLHGDGHVLPDLSLFYGDWLKETVTGGSVSSRIYEFFEQ